jgi:hypothetical protein
VVFLGKRPAPRVAGLQAFYCQEWGCVTQLPGCRQILIFAAVFAPSLAPLPARPYFSEAPCVAAFARGILMFRGLTALAMAAAMAPFVFFGMLILMMMGIATITTGPMILAFVAWMMLNKWTRKERERALEQQVIEARIVREAPQDYPAESYSPPAHFDLMLSAKHDIGRIRGAAGAIEDGAVARQFLALASAADIIHARLLAEPVKLGLARRYFSSYLPRTADLAEGYHRFRKDGAQDRRAKLIDVLYRLEAAMKEQKESLSAPDLSRVDADIRILTQDLQPVVPSFTKSTGPVRDRIDEIVKSAKKP